MTLPVSRALSAAMMSASPRSQVLGLVIELRGTPLPMGCKVEKEDWAHDEELGWFLKDTRHNLRAYEFGASVAKGDEGESVPGGGRCQENIQE